MTLENISLGHLTDNGFDAIQFSLMGMTIVFAGLVVIATYIVLLPKLLDVISSLRKQQKTQQPKQDETCENELEILLAISAATHLHLNFPEGNERITWKSHGELESPWQVSGRMHSLGVRKRRNSWNRK